MSFVLEHREDDVRQLALQASRYPAIDMPYALTQIAGWQSIRDKVPTWAACDDIIYPPHLPLEQCSSEATAIYKYGVVSKMGEHDSLADLTGGFGIDCWFMSHAFQHTTYVERQEELVKIAQHNFNALNITPPPPHGVLPLSKEESYSCTKEEGKTLYKDLLLVRGGGCKADGGVCHNVKVLFANNSLDWLQSQTSINWLYLDPARRDGHGGKTVAISDCEPDINALEETLVSKAVHVMVKLSPMLDLDLALHQLKHVKEAHIVSVDNECKELLLILNREVVTQTDHTPIHCVNIKKEETQMFGFRKAEEQQTATDLTKTISHYLYEPNASIMKAGAYRCVARRFDLQKLHANSHLYTSNQVISDFPGRVFQVEAVSGFGKKELKALLSDISKANLTVRNFPTSVAELRKRLHLSEGGDTYLFATTLHPKEKILIKCKRV